MAPLLPWQVPWQETSAIKSVPQPNKLYIILIVKAIFAAQWIAETPVLHGSVAISTRIAEVLREFLLEVYDPGSGFILFCYRQYAWG